VNTPAVTTARQAAIRLPTPEGLKAVSHTRSALKAEKYVRQAWGPLSALYDESGAQGHPYELLVLAEIQNELLS